MERNREMIELATVLYMDGVTQTVADALELANAMLDGLLDYARQWDAQTTESRND